MEKKNIGINKELNNILSAMYNEEILIELDKLLNILSAHDIEIKKNTISELRFTSYPCFKLILSRKDSVFYSYYLYFCFYDEKYVLIRGLRKILGGETFLTEFNSKLEEELPDDFTPHYPTKPPLAIVVDYTPY
mgnify:FL=1